MRSGRNKMWFPFYILFKKFLNFAVKNVYICYKLQTIYFPETRRWDFTKSGYQICVFLRYPIAAMWTQKSHIAVYYDFKSQVVGRNSYTWEHTLKMEKISLTIRKILKRYKCKEGYELCNTIILFVTCIFITRSILKLETQFFFLKVCKKETFATAIMHN